MLFENIYKDKKVLLTGDTGFKGSWLSIWLLELGAKVYGYALPPKTENDNFVKTKLHEHISHYNADVRNGKEILNYFQEVKPDIAFHMAAQPLVIESYLNPHYTFDTNLMGTVNFFEAVRHTPSVKVALNITSDKCYLNDNRTAGYSENDSMGGKDPYSASKGGSELITSAYLNSFFVKEGTCNVASARAGNVIGGGDWAEYRIVPDFFRALENDQTLLLRYPDATRPWQYVLEPLGGYLLLASKLWLEGKKFSGGWNFGPKNDADHTVLELVEEIIRCAGKGNYNVEALNEQVYEAGYLKLDISKAINSLKWRPVLNFQEAVKMTVEGYKDELIFKKDIYQARVEQINLFCQKAELTRTQEPI